MCVHETGVDPTREIRERAHAGNPPSVEDWREGLRDTVADPRRPVHLMGVGNELRTDDAAGLEVVSSLRSKLGGVPAPGVKIHPSSPTPERLLAKLASGKGRIVVFDAVEAAASPGDVIFRPMDDTKYGFFGTHNIPLKLVPGLEGRLGDVFLVGIQPGSLEVGQGLSGKVRESVREIVKVVAEGVAGRV